MRASGWITRGSLGWFAVAGLVGALATGCTVEASSTESVEARPDTETTTTTIYGGERDDDSEALRGVVALRVGTGGTFELCTGALVAPNVVLTARHCVTRNLTRSVSCDEDGQSANGEHVDGDEAPSDIGVYIGVSPTFGRQPATTARTIVAPVGPYLCDSDIALVILTSPITGVAPLPVRMDTPAGGGELIRSVGYGRNDATSPIGTRFRKAGVAVLAQGRGVSASRTPLGPHEFEVGKSICQGDSGGPAISEETGAVIGVVSRGGNCEENFGHIYTTTAGFPELFERAFTLANASPTLEDASLGVKSKVAASSDTVAPAPSVESRACAMSRAPATLGSARTAGLLMLAFAFLRWRRRR